MRHIRILHNVPLILAVLHIIRLRHVLMGRERDAAGQNGADKKEREKPRPGTGNPGTEP